MAALDKTLESMIAHKADLFSLKSGQTPLFHTGNKTRPIGSSPLSTDRVLAYLCELAGPAERSELEARTPVTFTYRDFAIAVAFPDGRVEAEVRPASAATPAPAADEAASPSADPTETLTPPPAAAAPRAQTAMEIDRSFDPRGAGVPVIDELFREMIGKNASDLHLSMGEPPRLRLHGHMTKTDLPPLTPARMAELLWPICSPKNRKEFESDSDTDFAYEVPGLARFRCNYFMDRMGMGAVFRQIPTKIPTMEQLGLPREIVDLCWLSKGFVVVTGPTGSGKSTTLAALINHINENRSDHIITIEDPIEFVHENKKCLLNQREVGTHTQGFKRALRAALREDPDIVLVGEMRDLETIGIAIETAETGHLVFGTLHTTTAPSTVDRIIDQFPTDRQTQIRVMLSETLKGVIAQTLCRKIGGGRIAAYEVLIVNTAVSNLIREGKTFQIPSLMQTQRAIGMRTLNDSLFELVKGRQVEPKEAYVKAVDKSSLIALYERGGIRFDPNKM
ncbi:MAG: type IV pilus twitching motility protein PilT [Candidatus Methylomirabilia bacterium]